MREAINRRSIVYNQQLEQVERMEAAGEIVVIRPQKPVVVDRIERDIKKLTELYEEGYRCAEHFCFSFLILREYTMRAGAISICSHIVFILFY